MHNRPQAVTGAPGTGKNHGDRQLRAEMPQADADMWSVAFFLYKDAVKVMDCLTQYGMITVDEVSQLSEKGFRAHHPNAADKIPALVFAGDFWQLPGIDGTVRSGAACTRSSCTRCGGARVLRKKLVALRTSKLLRRIARGHKAWSCHHEPTAWDLRQLYRSTPHTTIATCMRKAADGGCLGERALRLGTVAEASARRARCGLRVQRGQLRFGAQGQGGHRFLTA